MLIYKKRDLISSVGQMKACEYTPYIYIHTVLDNIPSDTGASALSAANTRQYATPSDVRHWSSPFLDIHIAESKEDTDDIVCTKAPATIH